MNKKYLIGVFNGFDVDDYYIHAASAEEAKVIALKQSGGESIYSVMEL